MKKIFYVFALSFSLIFITSLNNFVSASSKSNLNSYLKSSLVSRFSSSGYSFKLSKFKYPVTYYNSVGYTPKKFYNYNSAYSISRKNLTYKVIGVYFSGGNTPIYNLVSKNRKINLWVYPNDFYNIHYYNKSLLRLSRFELNIINKHNSGFGYKKYIHKLNKWKLPKNDFFKKIAKKSISETKIYLNEPYPFFKVPTLLIGKITK